MLFGSLCFSRCFRSLCSGRLHSGFWNRRELHGANFFPLLACLLVLLIFTLQCSKHWQGTSYYRSFLEGRDHLFIFGPHEKRRPYLRWKWQHTDASSPSTNKDRLPQKFSGAFCVHFSHSFAVFSQLRLILFSFNCLDRLRNSLRHFWPWNLFFFSSDVFVRKKKIYKLVTDEYEYEDQTTSRHCHPWTEVTNRKFSVDNKTPFSRHRSVTRAPDQGEESEPGHQRNNQNFSLAHFIPCLFLFQLTKWKMTSIIQSICASNDISPYFQQI